MNLGFPWKTNAKEIRAFELKQILDRAENTPYRNVVNKVVLRSLQKAKYSATNSGHFGLNSECYCHFTSPIRRYPDLVVHRILSLVLNGGIKEKDFAKWEEFTERAAVASTASEIKADEAEREVDDLKKTEYAAKRIGRTYTGIISGVTEFGVFVELPNTLEGLVRVENLAGGSYVFVPERYELTNSLRTYRLGDKMNITIASAQPETRRIEFVPAKESAGRVK